MTELADVIKEKSGLAYSAAMRMLEDHHLAEDAVQSVFIVLSEKREILLKNKNIDGWIWKTTVFVCRNMKRERARRIKRERNLGNNKTEEKMRNQHEWDSIKHDLDDAVFSLSQKLRDVIIARFFIGISVSEIAKRENISERAVSKRIKLGLEKLQKKLKPYAFGLPCLGLGNIMQSNCSNAPVPGLAEKINTCLSNYKNGTVFTNVASTAKGTMGMIKLQAIKSALLTVISGAAVIAVVGIGCIFAADNLTKQDNDAGGEKGYVWEKSPQADIYRKFNEYCLKRFGAEKEPLIYEKFGKELKLLDKEKWKYVSENSACIANETNLPAKSYIEYGESENYGKKTLQSERYFFTHIHYLKDLEVGKTYHYRLVCVDERGNKISSPDSTVVTKKIENAVYIPGKMEGPPYVLNKDNVTYVLKEDLTIDGLAILIEKGKVVLDLNGHTIIYNNKKMDKIGGAGFWPYINKSAYGIKYKPLRAQKSGIKVVNGYVLQGKGNNGSQQNSVGFGPLFFVGTGNEFSGLTLIYSGTQMTAAFGHYASAYFHHNVIIDCGVKIINRHQACRVLMSEYGDRANHNLIKRVRHQGLCGSQEICNNEVYSESCANNAFVFSPGKDSKVKDNKVFGTGYHVVGGGWGKQKYEYRNNFVHLIAEKPSAEYFKEYGARSNMVGLRLTLYGDAMKKYDDILYDNNFISVTSHSGGTVRGMQLTTGPNAKNGICKNCTIKSASADKGSHSRCLTLEGNPKNLGKNQPFIFNNVTFYANAEHVRFGDGNPSGSNFHFINCKFIKIGDNPNYKTIIFGYGENSANHIFRDCELENGASFDLVGGWNKNSYQSFSIEWTLTVKAPSGATVSAYDKNGKKVAEGKADDKGNAQLILKEFTNTKGVKEVFTPHTIKSEIGGKVTEKALTINKKMSISLIE